MTEPAGAERDKRRARAKLGALVWFFFGLLIFLFALQHQRIGGWDWHRGPFATFYAGTAVCWLISSALLIYAARSLKPRFSLRTLIVGTGLVALVLAMVKFFLFDRWYYQRAAHERAVALARQGDFDRVAQVIQGVYDTAIMREHAWWAVSRELASGGDVSGAVVALSHTTPGYTRQQRLKQLARRCFPAKPQQFLSAVRETMGPETEDRVRSYYASLVQPSKPPIQSRTASPLGSATK